MERVCDDLPVHQLPKTIMKITPQNHLGATLVVTLLAGVCISMGEARAQIEQVFPFNYGITGVRQDTGGNILITGGTDSPTLNTNSAAFLYDGPLNAIPSNPSDPRLHLFHAFNDTSNGSQFYGPNTSLFDPSIGTGNIRAVGAYKNQGATYQNSMLYTGSWTNIVAPGNGINLVGDTVAHSTMGSLVVGNYDYQGQENSGLGFIYNMTNQTYQTISLGVYSTTAYGIWQNGGSSSTKYSIVGGFSDVINGGKAYVVNYDSVTKLFTDFSSFSFNNNPSIVTHFEGISEINGGFSVTATTVQGASYAFIPTNNDGSFGAASWIAITNNIDTNSLLITGDTVIDSTVMGIYNSTNGTTNGIYSYISTVPEPSTYGLAGLGLLALLGIRSRCRFE